MNYNVNQQLNLHVISDTACLPTPKHKLIYDQTQNTLSVPNIGRYWYFRRLIYAQIQLSTAMLSDKFMFAPSKIQYYLLIKLHYIPSIYSKLNSQKLRWGGS